MTAIQWTDETWNPVTGCRKVSPGCANCYAEGVAERFWAKQYPHVWDGVGAGSSAFHRPRRFTDVQCHDDRLEAPLRWRKPRRVFVNSMSDLFHEDVPDAFVDRVLAVAVLTPQHTYQILTKRPDRMRSYMSRTRGSENVLVRVLRAARETPRPRSYNLDLLGSPGWPWRNVHLGVSVEDQERADERIPILLQTPAALRFISAEPLLGPVGIVEHMFSADGFVATPSGPVHRDDGGIALDWVIVGGESGPEARPCDVVWIRGVVRQCKDAGVPVFVKQLGSNPIATEDWIANSATSLHSKGGDPAEWPEDLRVREFPS